jgi:ABC-type lipoprotein release transport system permease subunit
VAAGVAVAVLAAILVASLASIRKALRLDPAEVFR